MCGYSENSKRFFILWMYFVALRMSVALSLSVGKMMFGFLLKLLRLLSDGGFLEEEV